MLVRPGVRPHRATAAPTGVIFIVSGHPQVALLDSIFNFHCLLSTFNFQPSTFNRTGNGGGLLVSPGNYLSFVQGGQLTVSHDNLSVDDDRFDIVVAR